MLALSKKLSVCGHLIEFLSQDQPVKDSLFEAVEFSDSFDSDEGGKKSWPTFQVLLPHSRTEQYSKVVQ